MKGRNSSTAAESSQSIIDLRKELQFLKKIREQAKVAAKENPKVNQNLMEKPLIPADTSNFSTKPRGMKENSIRGNRKARMSRRKGRR